MKYYFVFFLLISATVFGQMSDQQYLSEYKSAVNEFKEGKFESSLSVFEHLISQNVKNPMVPYAYLYGALAAEESGKRYQSKLLFRTLFLNFEDWDKLNDARILYAKQNFEDNYFDEAMKAIHEISNPKYDEQKINLIYNFISNIPTITSLKSLYNKYPNYKPIAEALVQKIQNNRYNTKADLELSDMLTNRFELNKKQTKSESKNTNSVHIQDEKLDFGLLLPFNIKTENAPDASVRYIFEIYQGMKIAAQKLSEEGINLSIHSYDVKNSAESFKKAETKPGFNQLDLIVGPLYASPNNLATKFIKDHNTIQVHPLSNNMGLLDNSENSYLFQPSFRQQASKALDYLGQMSTGNKTVSIYHGPSGKDGQFAKTYADVAEEKGYKVLVMKKYAEREKIQSSTGHIFFVGDNNLGVSFLKDIDISGLSNEIMVTANSFNWFNMDPTIFKDNVSLIYPEYIDIEKESVKEFEKLYYSNMYSFPTYYSYLGYDLAYYFAKKLDGGIAGFETKLRLNPIDQGTLLSGFDYGDGTRQNNIVPIVKFFNNRFEEVFR